MELIWYIWGICIEGKWIGIKFEEETSITWGMLKTLLPTVEDVNNLQPLVTKVKVPEKNGTKIEHTEDQTKYNR